MLMSRSRPVLFALLMLGFAVGLGRAPTAQADVLWLDQPLTNWNTPGMAVPRAPISDFSGNEAFCSGQGRPAETPEDNAVLGAGWKLFGAYQSGWGVRIVGGRAGFDGMCRPMDYQYFVFAGGRLAGTVSPIAMGARADGSASTPNLSTQGVDVNVQFARYAATDPLCCPSSNTAVSYRIDTTGSAPLLVPENAYTTQNQ
jgi:hypothetical protein